ncbi:MAG: hypothetical protein KZQ94_14280 [Candidatus Thiodiazotropha sp. (ex Troendleina suluensis)]|nr:hypothetical protein [Candidatus Thiodiazotropha sp. (ex Troendleina suluensis)]
MHKKEVFWQHHIDCWSQTTTTQAHYCRKNDLSQSDFSKWKKKLKPYAKRNLRKRPFNLEHRNFSSKVMQSQKAHRCSFCGHAHKDVNKLFYGQDELVAICDYCLWRKADKLHREVSSYKTIRFEKCSVCFEDKSGVVIGNVYYRVCADCLVKAWREQFTLHPESHPCRCRCIRCNTENPKEFMRVGAHVICQVCLIEMLKYFSFSYDVNRCSFCKAEKSDAKPMYGSNVRWICQSCSEKALSSIKELDQSNIEAPKCCSFCGIEKQKDIAFVERADGKICQSCIRESFELLTNSENDSD